MNLRFRIAACAIAIVLSTRLCAAPVGGPEEPVRYVGGESADANHDGGLRWAVGVKSWQALRANRAHPELSDDLGWTYNHAPMLAYWNSRFYIEYLSAPVHENKGYSHTMVMSSADGIHWDKPRVVFPVYHMPDNTMAEVHQRMGFYVAPNGRLLVVGFYGLPNHPNDGRGIGRVVREIKADGSFGPIHFIRYNAQNGWKPENTNYPLYTASDDAGFKAACDSLLANKPMTLQWLEEDRQKDGFFPDLGRILKALSFYHRRDGKIVGLWKDSWAALSSDEGRTWSSPVQVPTLVMAQAKVWGQRTADGRYALIYNPRADNRHRWPLAIVTGDDGITYDNLLTVQGEVPLRRYNGLDKAFGPQYNRGIAEGNGTPPGSALWDTYSMNKEDIWISRIPVPVRGTVDGPVNDTFDKGSFEELPWNTYSPRMAWIRIADVPSAANRSLELRDSDPYDYARAVRVFPESKKGSVRFKVLPKQTRHGRLEIEISGKDGNRPPIRLWFDDRGWIRGMDPNTMEVQRLTRYTANAWHDVYITFDVEAELFNIEVDGMKVLTGGEFIDPAGPLERLSFRTGEYRDQPTLRTPKSPGVDVPNPDEPDAEAVYYIDDVVVNGPQPPYQ